MPKHQTLITVALESNLKQLYQSINPRICESKQKLVTNRALNRHRPSFFPEQFQLCHHNANNNHEAADKVITMDLFTKD